MYLTIGSPYLPADRLSVDELAALERFVKDAPVLKSTDGFSNVPIGKDGDNVDYAIRAWQQLRETAGIDIAGLNWVFMLGQMEDAGWERVPNFRFSSEAKLPSHTRVLQMKSGNGAATIDAIELAADIVKERPSHSIALVAAEKVNTRFIRRRIGSQVFGDVAIACLATNEPLTDRALTVKLIGRPVALNDPRFFEIRPGGLSGDAEFLTSIRKLSHQAIELALASADVSLQEIQFTSTQNMSARLSRHIGEGFPLPENTVNERATIAHAPCVDLLANLSIAWSKNKLPRGSRVLLLSLGIGLSVAACIVEISNEVKHG